MSELLPPWAWIVLTGALTASACALVGSFLVLRKMAMLGDAISHAVLPGIALAFLISGSRSAPVMLVGAGLLGVLTAFITQFLHKRGRLQEDAAIGVTFTWLFAIGVILISAFAGQIDLDQECVLYGEIAYVPWDTVVIAGRDYGPRAVWLLAGVGLLNLAFLLIGYKQLKICSFDPALAATLGINVTLWHYLLMGAVSLTTVAAFESVGAILVVAMLVGPAAAAYLLTDRLSRMLIIAVLLGIASAGLGYLLAVWTNASIAGGMGVASGLLFGLALFFSPTHGVFMTRRAALKAAPVASFLLAFVPFLLAGCDTLVTETPSDEQLFDGPIAGLTAAQLATFAAGDEAFSEFFIPATGLGPIFNASACVRCHPADGRSHPSTNLRRFGRQPLEGPFDFMAAHGGPQLQDRAIPGYVPERLPEGITGLSVRGGPIVVGLGLVEAIPDAAILSREDPEDLDGDGISGRANFVFTPDWLNAGPDRVTRDGKYVGRFGRKATAVNLFQQTVGAYLNDIGITSDFETVDLYNPNVGSGTGDAAPDPEVSGKTIGDVVFYLQTLKPPSRRNASDPLVLTGEVRFGDIGCAGCHVPEMVTAWSPIEALSNRAVPLYSDLLLHDMGPDLADNYPEGDASGTEWRTTPLWGLGIVESALGGMPFYLHDGRTSDLSGAIRAHGGEAARSRDLFLSLPDADRQAVLAFLRSL